MDTEGAITEGAVKEASAIDVVGGFEPGDVADATTAEYERAVDDGSLSGRVVVPPGVEEAKRPPGPRERSCCLRRWVEFFAMV
jgi:hypothetical protein